MKILACFAIITALPIINSGMASEKVILKFDGETKTVGELAEVIQKAAVAGVTLVRFPTGQWKWHDLTQANFPEKESYAQTEFDAGDSKLKKKLEKWVKENEVNAVVIFLGVNSSADAFFEVERILSDLRIPYSFTCDLNSKEKKLNRGTLLETDGGVVTF